MLKRVEVFQFTIDFLIYDICASKDKQRRDPCAQKIYCCHPSFAATYCTVRVGEVRQCTTPLGSSNVLGAHLFVQQIALIFWSMTFCSREGLPGPLGQSAAGRPSWALGSGLWGQHGGSSWAMGREAASKSLCVMEKMVLSARPVFCYCVMPLKGES